MVPQVARKNPTDAPWRWCDGLRWRKLWKKGALIIGPEHSTRPSFGCRPKIVQPVRFAFFLLVVSLARGRKNFSSLSRRCTRHRQVLLKAELCSTFWFLMITPRAFASCLAALLLESISPARPAQAHGTSSFCRHWSWACWPRFYGCSVDDPTRFVVGWHNRRTSPERGSQHHSNVVPENPTDVQ